MKTNDIPTTLKTRTTTTSYICSFDGCEASFNREDRLHHHLRIHTGERPFVCSFTGCGKSYTRKEHLKRHSTSAHTLSQLVDLSLKCPHCSKTVKTSQNLKKHIKRIHEERIFQCAVCKKGFKKHQHLRIHEYEHTGVKPFRCQVENCDKSFLIPSKLKQHEKVHEGYTCCVNNCSEHFLSWTALRKHKLLVHVPENKCETCNRSFSSKQNLQIHIPMHDEMREAFHCTYDDCPRYYYFRKNLRQHVRCFHLNKRYICPYCEKSLCNQAKLKQHLKLHESKGSIPVAFKKKSKGRKKQSIASALSGFKPSKEEEILIAAESLAIDNGHACSTSNATNIISTVYQSKDDGIRLSNQLSEVNIIRNNDQHLLNCNQCLPVALCSH